VVKLSKSLLILINASAMVAVALAQGNQSTRAAKEAGPNVAITEAPPYDCGGTEKIEAIKGKVTGVAPAQYKLTIYAQGCNGTLYVQPTIASPLTDIGSDGGFEANIHLGHMYYVLLVPPTYKPKAEFTGVPQEGGDILFVAEVRGRDTPAPTGGKK
jgi:hypothetical protein